MASKPRRRRRRRSSRGLGALSNSLEILKSNNLKEIAVVGSTAVAGQLVTQSVVDKVAPMIAGKDEQGNPKVMDPTMRALLEVLVGLVGGGVLWSLAKSPKLGMAFALGPIVQNGTRQVAQLLAGSGGGVAGLARPVGDIVPLPDTGVGSLSDVVQINSIPTVGSSLISA